MNDEMLFLQETIDEALTARHPTDWAPPEDGGIAAESWDLCTELGWDHAGLPEDLGGLGHGVAPLSLLAWSCGRHRLPLPLPETALARWAIAIAGLEQPDAAEILTTPFRPSAGLELTGDSGCRQANGRLHEVPWARHARQMVATSSSGTLVIVDLPSDQVQVEPGTNVAGEARDDVILNDAPATEVDHSDGRAAASLLADRAALLRSAQIGGALASALALTREHTASRKQFGRPLDRFQLVGAHLAEMTAQIAITEATLQDAIRAHDAGHPQPATASLALTAAQAAAEVARAAHQCHGAIGATREYQLHQFTRRLWAWRDEAGTERYWRRRLGEATLADADAGAGLWAATAPHRGL